MTHGTKQQRGIRIEINRGKMCKGTGILQNKVEQNQKYNFYKSCRCAISNAHFHLLSNFMFAFVSGFLKLFSLQCSHMVITIEVEI